MMKIEFNGTQYRTYDSLFMDAIDAISADGTTMVSVSDVLELRLGVENQPIDREHESTKQRQRLLSTLWDNGIETCDALVVHPEGRAKMVHGFEELWTHNCTGITPGGRIQLPDGAYESMACPEINGIDAETGKILQFDSEEGRRIYGFLSRGWESLDEYKFLVDRKYRFNCHDKTMDIFVPAPEEVPYMINWKVSRRGSALSAMGSVEDASGATLVMAKDGRRAASGADLLEMKVKNALEQGRPFRYRGKLYVPVHDDEFGDA